MFEPPYRALRILLGVFSLLAALGGLLMIFADKPLIVRMLLRPPEREVSTLVVSLLWLKPSEATRMRCKGINRSGAACTALSYIGRAAATVART
jgi:hypothetical protein